MPFDKLSELKDAYDKSTERCENLHGWLYVFGSVFVVLVADLVFDTDSIDLVQDSVGIVGLIAGFVAFPTTLFVFAIRRHKAHKAGLAYIAEAYKDA